MIQEILRDLIVVPGGSLFVTDIKVNYRKTIAYACPACKEFMVDSHRQPSGAVSAFDRKHAHCPKVTSEDYFKIIWLHSYHADVNAWIWTESEGEGQTHIIPGDPLKEVIYTNKQIVFKYNQNTVWNQGYLTG